MSLIRNFSAPFALLFCSITSQATAPANDMLSTNKPNTTINIPADAEPNCTELASRTGSYVGFLKSCSNCIAGSTQHLASGPDCLGQAKAWCMESWTEEEGCTRTDCHLVDSCKKKVADQEEGPGRGGMKSNDMANPSEPKPGTTTAAPPKPNPTSTPSPTPSSPTSAPSNPTYGSQDCEMAATQARSCCYNPSSCITTSAYSQPAPGQSLSDYCAMMSRSGLSNNTDNNSAATACSQRINTCVSTCSSSSGENAQSQIQACRDLSSRVQLLASQGLASGGSGTSGNICQNISQAQPSSMNGMPVPPPTSANSNDPYGCQTNPMSQACQSCATNPTGAACRALNNVEPSTGDSSFASIESTKGESGFDIPTLPVDPEPPSFGGGANSGGPAPAGATVANNSGGSIPGGTGGGPGAKMDIPKGASPGSPGYTTDILTGFQSAGGGGATAGGSTDTDDGGGFQGYGGNGSGHENGIDLSKFLPGGDKDPMRGPAAFTFQSAQINPKSVDIWNKISVRIQEKCRLGELIGCE